MEVSVMSKVSGGLRALLVAAAFLLAIPIARAEDNPTNNTGVVDCNDANTKSSCAECCTGPGCLGRISCCSLSGCTIKGEPSGPPPLNAAAKLKFVIGGLNLQFLRIVKADYVDVKLKASFVKKTFPKGVNAKVRLTGPDASLAGFVWPVAFLGQGDSAPTALSNAGINATIEGAPPTCQSLFPAQACTDMAVGLSRMIQGGIGVADRTDVDRFLDAVNNMGLGPCGIIF
jgi:hypothetical protein